MYQDSESNVAAREPILPPAEEWAELAAGPGSITWERAGDVRTFAAAGMALMLQVAHPTVGAGVHDFSTFAQDPWGRLWRTLDFTTVLVFDEPAAAAEMGSRVRGFHKVIKGTKPDGTPYHALEPEAYAWVHLTLYEGVLRAHQRFGKPFTVSEAERFWAEWRKLGRFLGVRWRDMPETYGGYRDFVDAILNERIERNAAVEEVYEALTSAPPPPSKRINETVWGLATRPMLRFAGLSTVGLLHPVARQRLGLTLTRAQRLELRALGRLSRATTPLLPARMRNVGADYLKMRAKPIARGDVASLEHNPHLRGLAS